MDIVPLLARLSEASGVSGYEHEIREIVKAEFGRYADEVRTDILGNVSELTTDIFNGLGYGKGPLVDPLGSFLVGTPEHDLMPAVVSDGVPGRAHRFEARGGSHPLPSSLNTVDDRVCSAPPEFGDSAMGFRLVRTLYQ